MIQNSDTPWQGDWGPLDMQQECEFCDRGIIGRFGGQVSAECDSCAADFQLLHKAGKIREDGWSLVVVKIGDADEAVG